MVACLPSNKDDHKEKETEEPGLENRIIQALIRRLGSSKTFGENIIFMLNRAGIFIPLRPSPFPRSINNINI